MTDSDGAKQVDEYLARVPEPGRSTLNAVRAMIRAAAPPEATECISYQVPAFRHKKVLVGYAAFPGHCSFFVMSPAVMEAHAQDLKKYETSKGTIRFPLEKPLPAALVRKLVKARLAENAAPKKG